MGKEYGLTPENKGAVDAAIDFPRLSLKKDEIARLAIFDIKEGEGGKKGLAMPAPEGMYTFSLRTAEDRYLGDYECLADEETKAEDGFDPDVCPHCEAVLAGVSEDLVGKRRRRFVMPVFRYHTKTAKKADVSEPVGGQVIAWRFTDRYFNQLVDEHMRWQDSGGLLNHDLTLLCEVEGYQTFKISVEPDAVWRKSQDITKQVVAALLEAKKELPQGLAAQLGRKVGKDDMVKKIAEATGSVGADVPDLSSEDQAEISDLASDLFGNGGSSAEEAGIETAAPEAAEATDEGTEAAAPASTEETVEEMDFDAFFEGS